MAYVTPLYGGSDEQVNYRLGLVEHGCGSDRQFAYHTDARERPLRWIGSGLEAFGVEGLRAGAELTEAQFEMARRLIRGQHPETGEQLVAPKVAVPASAKLSLGPLVAAIEEVATARGVVAAELFGGDPVLAGAWEKAARGVSRRGGRAVARVDEATRLAGAAGVDPGVVWGAARVDEARSALYELREVTDDAGRPVLGADGTPEVEMVERRERVGIAGYDIGITLPKSLSVLLAFAPEQVVDRIEDAYAQAADRTLGWTEERTSYVKRGKHGEGKVARQERSSGFSGWVMTHRAARPVGDAEIGDPHWHVHITIGNLAQAPDGTWLTVAAGGRELMRHAAAIDKVTQAQIRAELGREFGISFTRSERTGLWEVEHIPQSTLDLFSQRHHQVSEVLAALGYSNATASAKDARVLTRASRSAKSETTAAADTTLRGYWRDRALAAGLDPDVWMPRVLAGWAAGASGEGYGAGEAANAAMVERHGISLDGVVARLTDPQVGLTAHSRRFSQLEALTAVAEALPKGATLAEVERLTDLVLAHPAFMALPERQLAGGPGEHAQLAGSHQMVGGAQYTTRDVPELERRILAAIERRHDRTVAADILAMAVSVAEAAQGFALSTEQRRVLEIIVTSPRSVQAVEGPAGTGKTTLMRAGRVAWEAQGYRVAGAATAAVAAQKLASDSGIESRTVEQLLCAIRHGRGLEGIDKLVLDEANLTDDRDRAALYAACERAGVEIVEIGDSQQLRTPGVGSLFGYVRVVTEGPALTENRRQHQEDERVALAAFREGRYHEALSGWAQLGQVVATKDTTDGISAMVSEWMRRAEGAPDPHTRLGGLLMLASTNEQVDRLNQAVQAVRGGHGQLGDGRVFRMPAGRRLEFRVGDQVLIRRNDRTNQAVAGEAVLNGYRGVVTGVDEGGVSVQWRQPGDTDGAAAHTATCSPKYVAEGGLELGYALTTHKAEGLTVDAGWDRPDGSRHRGSTLLWGPGMDNPGQYVAASRARGETIWFGALEELEGDRERLAYGVPRDQAELTERVIAALAERAAATASNDDDRPILADLGEVPAEPAEQSVGREDVAPVGEPRHDAAAASNRGDPAGIYQGGGDAARLAELGFSRTTGETPGGEEQPTAEVAVTEDQRRRWAELEGQRASAWLAREQDTARLLENQLASYRTELGPERVEILERERRERLTEMSAPKGGRAADGETERSEVPIAEADREHYNQLLRQAWAARRSGEPAAEQEAEAALEAYRAQVGQDWVDAFRRDQTRRLDDRITGRERRQAWRSRADSQLPDEVLERQRGRELEKRAQQLAALEHEQARLAEAEPAVVAGNGPKVAALHTRLAQLRRDAELAGEVEQLRDQRAAATRAAEQAATAAVRRQVESVSTSWWRRGRRDELAGEAARLRTSAAQARAEAAAVGAQLDELSRQHGMDMPGWADPGRTRDAADRAAASYQADLEAARQADLAELARGRQRLERRSGEVEAAQRRHDALAQEQRHRAEQPRDVRAAENIYRAEWAVEQAKQAAAARAHEAEQAAARSRDYHYQGPAQQHTQDRDQGHGLSR